MTPLRTRALVLVTCLALCPHLRSADERRFPIAPQYERVVDEAKAAVRNKQYDLAIARLTAALGTNPDQRSAAVLHDERASAYDLKGDLAKAFADANAAIRLAPRYFDGYIQRGVVHRQRGELDAAIRDYDMALRLNPDYVPAYNNRGVAYSQRGDEARAIRDYNEALRRDPNYANAYMNRAVSFEIMGDFERALVDYGESIRRERNVENAHYNRARLHSGLRNFEAAIADASVAARRGGLEGAAALLLRGRVYRELGTVSAAKADYARASVVAPATGEGYRLRGFAHLYLGDYPMAANSFAKALQILPNDPETLAASAWFLATCPDAKFRNGEKALAQSTRALRLLKARKENALDSLAAAYAEVGNFERAIHYQREAMTGRHILPFSLQEMKEHLERYEQRRPYREEARLP